MLSRMMVVLSCSAMLVLQWEGGAWSRVTRSRWSASVGT